MLIYLGSKTSLNDLFLFEYLSYVCVWPWRNSIRKPSSLDGITYILMIVNRSECVSYNSHESCELHLELLFY